MSKQRVKSAKAAKAEKQPQQQPAAGKRHPFHLEFRNQAQKMAWAAFDQHDVLFLLGSPGTGKTHLAMAFAISEILAKRKKKIVLTRPIVEAGESLGYLPGTFEEKVNPYMMPLFDCMERCLGPDGPQRDIINKSVELAPIAYMRGRSQPMDAKVLTPEGYKTMAEIKEGSFVVGSDGTPTRVEKIYPQGELDVYKVSFTDGTSVECSADHLWDTTSLYERRYNKSASTKTTVEISESIKYGHAYNHQIPMAKPVQFAQQDLEIDPYVLGALLGDGCLHKTACVTLTSVDDEIVSEVANRLPQGLKLVLAKDQANRAPQYRIVTEERGQNNTLKEPLRRMDILGNLSHQKSIPASYLQGSVSQRLALLRGLMDTDGCCFEQKGKRKPRVQYYSTSLKLAQNVASLVHSLGGTASVRHRKKIGVPSHELHGRPVVHNHDVYVVSIRMYENPFNLSRKADKFVPLKPVRAITKIEKVGRKECQCIRVAAEDSLYLTDHCIVTHNTFNDAICLFDEAQNATYMQLKLFLSRFGENSKIIITGDPNQSDLRPQDRALMSVVEKLSSLKGIGIINFKASSIVRHPLIGAIMEKLEGKEENGTNSSE